MSASESVEPPVVVVTVFEVCVPSTVVGPVTTGVPGDPLVVVGPVAVGTGPTTTGVVLLGPASTTAALGFGLGTVDAQLVVGAPELTHAEYWVTGVLVLLLAVAGVPWTTVVTGVFAVDGVPGRVVFTVVVPLTTVGVCV